MAPENELDESSTSSIKPHEHVLRQSPIFVLFFRSACQGQGCNLRIFLLFAPPLRE